VTQLHAGEEQDSQTGRHDDRCCAEIRLQQQQQCRTHQHAERLEESLQILLELRLLAHDVAREIGQQQHAGELRPLEVHEARAQPAPAPVHFVTDARDQHDHQDRKREQQQRQADALPHVGGNHHRDHGRNEPEHHADHLLLEVAQRLVQLLVGDRDRRGRHHDEAEQQQRAGGQHQDRVEREAPRAGAGAGEGECGGVHASSLRTDAANM
jgi:hypothetical protein